MKDCKKPISIQTKSASFIIKDGEVRIISYAERNASQELRVKIDDMAAFVAKLQNLTANEEK